MKLGLVLLAAGNARRFGENKLLHSVNGEPMGMTAISLYQDLALNPKVYVTQASFEELWGAAEQAGYRVVVNHDPARGQSSSIALGLWILLQQGGIDCDGVLFAVSDQPYLRRDSIERLMEAFATDTNSIFALSHGERRGNPVIFPKALLPELMRLKGDVGGRQVIQNHPDLVRLVPCRSAEELNDIDERS